jgi:hypothetical protein
METTSSLSDGSHLKPVIVCWLARCSASQGAGDAVAAPCRRERVPAAGDREKLARPRESGSCRHRCSPVRCQRGQHGRMGACVARWAAVGRKGRGVSEAEEAVQTLPDSRAKAINLSTKHLLSAILDIPHTVKFWSAKRVLPSALSRALDKAFVEC